MEKQDETLIGTAETIDGDPIRFTLFRGRDAAAIQDTAIMSHAAMPQVVLDGLERFADAGSRTASLTSVVFAAPGVSLLRVCFKSGFPVILHSHDADCTYYIVAGSARIGTEELGVGDGFFVPANVPYSYTVGSEGIELLEFRSAATFDVNVLARNPKYWDRVSESASARADIWKTEPFRDIAGEAPAMSKPGRHAG